MAASSVGRQPRRWSADGSGGGLKGRNPRSIAPGLQCTLTSVTWALSGVLQAMCALHALHTVVGAVHNDTHLGNLLGGPSLRKPVVQR